MRGPSLYVRIWDSDDKDGPRTERIKIIIMAVNHNIGIQMKRNELTKT